MPRARRGSFIGLVGLLRARHSDRGITCGLPQLAEGQQQAIGHPMKSTVRFLLLVSDIFTNHISYLMGYLADSHFGELRVTERSNVLCAH